MCVSETGPEIDYRADPERSAPKEHLAVGAELERPEAVLVVPFELDVKRRGYEFLSITHLRNTSA